jgi:hypothetical protein
MRTANHITKALGLRDTGGGQLPLPCRSAPGGG